MWGRNSFSIDFLKMWSAAAPRQPTPTLRHWIHTRKFVNDGKQIALSESTLTFFVCLNSHSNFLDLQFTTQEFSRKEVIYKIIIQVALGNCYSSLWNELTQKFIPGIPDIQPLNPANLGKKVNWLTKLWKIEILFSIFFLLKALQEEILFTQILR